MPENQTQMFDILSELRVYAATNRMPHLAEKLDDALIVLLEEDRIARSRQRAATGSGDSS